MGQTSQNLVGARVKEARAAAQPPVTQEALSKKLAKLGVSIDRAGVAKIETGQRSLVWIWTRSVIEWLQLAAWKYLP